MLKKIAPALYLFHFFLLSAYAIFPFIKIYFNDANYPPLKTIVRLICLVVIGISFASFVLILFLESRKKITLSITKKVVASALLAGFFLCIRPAFSIDLHCYIMQGRILALHHANPYLVAPIQFPNDPFIEGIFWKYVPVFYGPVWVITSALMSLVAGNSLFLNIFFMKIPIMVSYIALILGVYALASIVSPRKKEIAATCIAGNPFIVIHYLLDGHNDIMMVALAICALHLLSRKKTVAGYLLFSLSILVKYITLLLVPLIVTAGDKKNKVLGYAKNLTIFAVLCALTTIAFFGPFFIHGNIVEKLSSHKLAGNMGIDSNTIPYLILSCVRHIPVFTGIDPASPSLFVKHLFYAFFALLYAAIMAYFLRRRYADSDEARHAPYTAASLIIIAYFIFGAFSFGAWFLIWLIPFILLSRMPYAYTLTIMLSAAGAISFWKRPSILLALVGIVYVVACIGSSCLGGKRELYNN